MKVGLLTSSRADFGIYQPLLDKIKKDPFFDLEVIAFGTHTSNFHGHTISDIRRNFEGRIHYINSLITGDDQQAISTSYGLTILKFADFWSSNQYDLVFCLGDRFEMSSAVQAGIPFGVNFAHIHGGETTLGAIDNVYRHQITLASKLHFTSTANCTLKVEELLGANKDIYTVGSLSLDDVANFSPIEKNEFYKKFKIFSLDFALVTFHPETVDSDNNEVYATEMKLALGEIAKYLALVVTMPNADTLGTEYRKQLNELKEENPEKVVIVENFGKLNYFSAMYYAKVLIGNTSSGILEAASFGKYVVNVGNRQKGREKSKNVVDASFNSKDIKEKTILALEMGEYKGENIYFQQGAADKIIKTLRTYLPRE